MMLWHFVSTQDHIELEILKRYSTYSFHLVSPNFRQNILVMGNTGCYISWRPVKYYSFMTLCYFNMGVKGNPKMWIISRTDNHRVKRAKSSNTGVLWSIMFVLVSLGSFGALWKISDVKIFKRQFWASFDANFSRRSTNNEKCYYTWKFSLRQNRMGLQISKLYSPYSFNSISAKFDDKYPGNGRTPGITFLGDLSNIKIRMAKLGRFFKNKHGIDYWLDVIHSITCRCALQADVVSWDNRDIRDITYFNLL